MNLFQRYKMQSPTAQSIASAMLGTRTKHAPSVVRTNVQALFNRGQNVRGLIDARSEIDYVFGQAGVGLGRLSQAFSGLGSMFMATQSGDYVLNDCAQANFYNMTVFKDLKAHGQDGGATYFRFDYEPPDASLKKNAEDGYTYLKLQSDLNNPQAQGRLSQLDDQMKKYITAANSIAEQHDPRVGCGDALRSRGWDDNQNLWLAYKGIVDTMRQFATATSDVVPKTSASGGASGGAVDNSNVGVTTTGNSTQPGTYSDPLQQSYLDLAHQQQAADAQAAARAKSAAAASQAATQAEGTSSGLMKWALPAVALVAVGGGLYIFLRK